MNVNTFDCKNVRMSVIVQSLSDSSHIYSEDVPVNEYYASGQTAFFSTSFEVAGASEAFEIIVKVVGGSIASGQEASVSVDNLMLEKNIGNSAYSLVQMGNFENFSVDSSGTYLNYSKNFWTNASGSYAVRNVGAPFGLSAYLTASLTGERYMKQTLYQAPSSLMAAYDNHNYYGESAKTYIVSGFGRGTGQVANPDAAFRIRVDLTYYMGSGKDDIVVPFYFDFQTGCKDWQFVCGNVETADNYMVRSIVLYCEYSYQPIGYALFDEIAFTESTDESVVKYEYYGKEIAGDQRPANSALDGLLRLKKSGYYTEIYEYDNDRRLTRVANNRGEIHDYSYAANSDNIANEIYYKFRQGNNGPRIYPYLTSNPDELITKVPQTKTSYTYNAYGQAQTVKTYEAEYNSSGNVTLKSGTKNIYSHKQYNVTSGSKYFGALLQEIDGLGRSTQYYYDANSGRLLACISINEKSGTCYSYDALGNIRSVLPAKYSSAAAYSPVSGKESVNYTYNESNLLESITTGSTTYNFTYNVFGNADTVSVGEAELASYEYNAHNGKLNKVHYGNGFSVRYVYDKLDNVKEVWYKEGSNSEVKAYAYSYTAQGQLYRFENLLSGKNTVYKYDTAGKLIAFIEYDGDEMVNEFSSSMYYNDEGKLQMVWYSLDYSFASGTADHSPNYFYSYNPDGSLKNTEVDAVTATGNIRYIYDTYNRLTGKTSDFYLTADSTKRFTNTVGYTFSSSGSYTSAQVASYTSKVGSNDELKYTYTYDGNGNITKITTTAGDEIRYKYDDLGQLIREDNSVRNQTYVYTYDNAGNILSKKTYALTAAGSTPTSPTSTNTYSYGNANWGDLLTSFNGNAITYDAIGNPLSYNNGTSYTYNFTWENGRRLASATYGSNTITYTYNDEGIRTSKNVSGIEHIYHLDGSRIIAEEWGNSLCIYLYDADGRPVGMQYRAKGMAEGEFYTFWFEKNLQGDIIAVYNDSGVKTLSYSYDAWGNATVTRHNATGKNGYATYNPFRYRGYYYDTETGFYYLQSRYYDPNTGRFVNADTSSALTASPLSLTDKNLFSYCDNNPVARSDYDGEFWHIVIGAVVGAIGGAVSSVVSQALSGEEINWKAVGISAASGAVSGAVTAAFPCMSPVLTGVVQGGISAATYAATEKIAYGRDPSLKDVIEVGVTSGVMAGGMQYVGQELGFVQCFIAGTLVSTKAGLVPIEEIQPGDLVWASDPETGETALKEVVQLFRNETEEWIHVTVDDEEITCTPNHPFYSPVKGWTSACDLRAGDILVTVNGEYVVVEKVQHELLENPETTYNFEVEGFHTYYVGDTEVLVHNKCKNDYQTKNTTQKSAQFGSEREARNLARTKVGHNPVNVGDGKLRSSDGTWQYRAKPGDILQRHIHLEKLNPMTGEVIINWHLRW